MYFVYTLSFILDSQLKKYKKNKKNRRPDRSMCSPNYACVPPLYTIKYNNTVLYISIKNKANENIPMLMCGKGWTMQGPEM